MIWPCDWLRDHVSHTPTQMWNHAPPKKKKRNMKFDYIYDFFSHHWQTDWQTDRHAERELFSYKYFCASNFSSLSRICFMCKYGWNKRRKGEMCFDFWKVNKIMNETLKKSHAVGSPESFAISCTTTHFYMVVSQCKPQKKFLKRQTENRPNYGFTFCGTV